MIEPGRFWPATVIALHFITRLVGMGGCDGGVEAALAIRSDNAPRAAYTCLSQPAICSGDHCARNLLSFGKRQGA
ncbi:protein of unknown function (plasmid) [Cupriavidus taiwanensis]|uniref:Uncharacterized protein n=1 Tax=Cupriavidus taiwanensis TaxID=164546 RepID=A0A375IVG6_9BURK|nr:protein of unknown function [Cupriavidus taiwanensis]